MTFFGAISNQLTDMLALLLCIFVYDRNHLSSSLKLSTWQNKSAHIDYTKNMTTKNATSNNVDKGLEDDETLE